MKTNPGIMHTALVAWDGAAAIPRDVTNYSQWAFVFEVKADLAADAIFEVDGFDRLAADRCQHDPATAEAVVDIPICTAVATPAPNSRFIIPAGTKAGTVCSGTTPCNVGPFVGLRHISGGADVSATILMTGIRH